MIRYEVGFMNKCAEYGVDAYRAGFLCKMAQSADGKSRRNRRMAGNALIAAGLSIPAVFGARGFMKGRKAMKLFREGALASRDLVDDAVRAHMKSTGADLPKYFWDGAAGSGTRVFDGSAKAMADAVTPKGTPRILKWLIEKRGPHYSPIANYVYAGEKVNPKVLMHELGHARDAANGSAAMDDVFKAKTNPIAAMKEAWRGLVNPENTALFNAERSAWDNARILAGDATREAALDTYRNAARANGASTFIATPLALGGYGLRRSGRDRKND